MKLFFKHLLAAFLLAGAAHPTFAEENTAAEVEARAQAVLSANEDKTVYGPATVNLGDQATMKLAYGQAFIPPEVAIAAFTSVGQANLEGLLGLIVPGIPGDAPPSDNWGAVSIFFQPTGFIRDAEAQTWDTDQMLRRMQDSIKKSNKTATKRGLPERELLGWIERPAYRPDTHRLLWAIEAQHKGKPATAMTMFSGAALGCEGVLIFTFGTASADLPVRKHLAPEILGSITYKEGKRYQDFVEGTDRVAEIGLAALVSGVVAKKMGLFAALAVLLAKWGKALALVAGGFVIFKTIRGKKAADRDPDSQ